jgi:hypothetical protein
MDIGQSMPLPPLLLLKRKLGQAQVIVQPKADSVDSRPAATNDKKRSNQDWSHGLNERMRKKYEELEQAKKRRLSDGQPIPFYIGSRVALDDIFRLITFLRSVAKGESTLTITGEDMMEMQCMLCMKRPQL